MTSSAIFDPYLRNENEDEMYFAIFYFYVLKIEVFIIKKQLSKLITILKVINLSFTNNYFEIFMTSQNNRLSFIQKT